MLPDKHRPKAQYKQNQKNQLVIAPAGRLPLVANVQRQSNLERCKAICHSEA
jgi:hypothetical protein